MAHILLVEDEPLVAESFKDLLEHFGHTVDWISNGREAHAAIFDVQFTYDLLLCDLHLPGMTGRELLKEVNPYLEGKTPVVIISGVAFMIEALGELAQGAFAVVQKPIGMSAFGDIVTRALRQRDAFREIKRLGEQVRDLQERNRVLVHRNDELFDEARIDPLTGLGNRRRLLEELQVLDANAVRYEAPFALVLCDVDSFGDYNRSYSMEVGDEVLRLLGETIGRVCRQGDTVYRYGKEDTDRAFRFGGDEFVLILAGQDEAGAVKAVERLQRALQEAQASAAWSHCPDHPVTISAGVAANDPSIRETVEMLQGRANDQLKKAKLEGGDCVCPRHA